MNEKMVKCTECNFNILHDVERICRCHAPVFCSKHSPIDYPDCNPQYRIEPTETEECEFCGQPMSEPNSIRIWDGTGANMDLKKEWICSKCEKKIIKAF